MAMDRRRGLDHVGYEKTSMKSRKKHIPSNRTESNFYSQLNADFACVQFKDLTRSRSTIEYEYEI